jgi:undecaprenyl-diphosphatase
MDHNIFLAINGLAGLSPILDSIGIFLADNFIYFFIVGIALLWLKRDLHLNIYVAFISALISRVVIVELIKQMVARPRPFEILDVHKLLIDEGSGKSFPSGHTVIFFSIAFAFWGTRWFWPLVVLATLASLSRIFVGVHYPLDVLVGAIIGALVSLILMRLLKNRILS